MAKKIGLFVIAVAVLAAPHLAHTQQPAKKIPRIGILSPSARDPALDEFRQGLRELGWVEGKNIAFEHRWADGNEERLPALAAQLVEANVEIILSTTPRATLAARQVSRDIPIIETF